MGPGPFLEMPVVVGPHQRQHELGIVEHGEPDSAKPERGRKVERRIDPVRVHVGDPGLDVPRASSDHVEAQGLHILLLCRLAHDGVDRDLGHYHSVEQPRLGAVGQIDDAGLPVGELLR